MDSKQEGAWVALPFLFSFLFFCHCDKIPLINNSKKKKNCYLDSRLQSVISWTHCRAYDQAETSWQKSVVGRGKQFTPW